MFDKFGFVYLWFDRKHNRFYVGSHWGTINDGYICSSRWMRKAYKRRSHDFKRRIIARVFTNRKDLLREEHRWLSMIKEHELTTRYYNITKHLNGHWSAEDSSKTIMEKISIKTKEAMQDPEIRQKYLEGLNKRDNRSSDPAVREKRRQSMLLAMAKKYPPETRLSGAEKQRAYKARKKLLATENCSGH